nr:hypothetical protein NCPCFENI_01340 [Cupriavidus sp.]
MLTAGADEQVGLGQVGETEIGGERLLGDRHISMGEFGLGIEQLTHGLQHVPAAAVVYGHGEHELGIGPGGLCGLDNGVLQRCGKGTQVADYPQLHTVGVELAHLAFECPQKQSHQKADLFFWPTPVLRTKGKYGEGLNASRHAGRDRAAKRRDATLVTGHTGKTPF